MAARSLQLASSAEFLTLACRTLQLVSLVAFAHASLTLPRFLHRCLPLHHLHSVRVPLLPSTFAVHGLWVEDRRHIWISSWLGMRSQHIELLKRLARAIFSHWLAARPAAASFADTGHLPMVAILALVSRVKLSAVELVLGWACVLVGVVVHFNVFAVRPVTPSPFLCLASHGLIGHVVGAHDLSCGTDLSCPVEVSVLHSIL